MATSFMHAECANSSENNEFLFIPFVSYHLKPANASLRPADDGVG